MRAVRVALVPPPDFELDDRCTLCGAARTQCRCRALVAPEDKPVLLADNGQGCVFTTDSKFEPQVQNHPREIDPAAEVIGYGERRRCRQVASRLTVA